MNVWGKATGTMDLTTPATTFSNVVGKELVVNAHVQVDFPNNYISAMHDRDIYGTHVFKIMDASNKAVSLPAGTKALLTDKDGKTLLATRVTTPTSTVRYELDKIVSLARGDRLTDDLCLRWTSRRCRLRISAGYLPTVAFIRCRMNSTSPATGRTTPTAAK